MKNPLQTYKDLGVKTLAVKDNFATAVNPYEELVLNHGTFCRCVECSHYVFFESTIHDLPPLPTSGIENGTIGIEDVEERPFTLTGDTNEWVQISWQFYHSGKLDNTRIQLVPKYIKPKQVKEKEPKAEIEILKSHLMSMDEYRESKREMSKQKSISEYEPDTYKTIQPQKHTFEGVLRNFLPPPKNEAEKNDDINILSAMQEYADQQLAQYKAKVAVEIRETVKKSVDDGIILGVKESYKSLNQLIDKKSEKGYAENITREDLKAFMDTYINIIQNS